MFVIWFFNVFFILWMILGFVCFIFVIFWMIEICLFEFNFEIIFVLYVGGRCERMRVSVWGFLLVMKVCKFCGLMFLRKLNGMDFIEWWILFSNLIVFVLRVFVIKFLVRLSDFFLIFREFGFVFVKLKIVCCCLLVGIGFSFVNVIEIILICLCFS